MVVGSCAHYKKHSALCDKYKKRERLKGWVLIPLATEFSVVSVAKPTKLATP
jgi:hypothetical protein